MKITTAIVEDKKNLADSLKQNLALFEQIELSFIAENGKIALEQLKNTASSDLPQVILMDIEMPEMNGIQATEQIKKLYPNIKIIILTVFDQDDKIFDAICNGASGYFLKEERIHTIVNGMEEVLEGGAPMSPSIASKTLRLLKNSSIQKEPSEKKESFKDFQLTKREIEVLEQVVEGLTYTQIAEKLFISPGTVRKHIENTYHKLHVHSKMEAFQIAKKNNWFLLI